MIKINYPGRTATLQEVGSTKKYKCLIADSAIKDVETISKAQEYLATIREGAILFSFTNKKEHKYELLSFKSEPPIEAETFI